MNQNKKGTSAMLLTFSSWELLRNVKIGKSGRNAQAVKLSVANQMASAHTISCCTDRGKEQASNY